MSRKNGLAVRETQPDIRRMSKKEAYEIIDALPVRTRIKTVKPLTVTEKPKTMLPFGILFMLCIFAVLFLFIALLNVKINEVSNDIISLNDELIEISQKNDEVNAQLSEKNDLTVIDKIAREEYGMVKYKQLPARYVSVAGEEEAEVLEVEEERILTVSSMLSAFGGTLNDFAEYLK